MRGRRTQFSASPRTRFRPTGGRWGVISDVADWLWSRDKMSVNQPATGDYRTRRRVLMAADAVR